MSLSWSGPTWAAEPVSQHDDGHWDLVYHRVASVQGFALASLCGLRFRGVEERRRPRVETRCAACLRVLGRAPKNPGPPPRDDVQTSGPWLSVSCTARALGIDRKTARGWIQRGLIQGVKLPNGYHRVHAGVVAYLAEPLRRHARAVQLALDLGSER